MKEIKKIEIANQPILGAGRIIRITVDGIRYRLFRSFVTVAVIAVAVAFLMNILSYSLYKRAVGRDTRERITRMNIVNRWAAKLTTVSRPEDVIHSMAAAEEGDGDYQESMAFGGFSDVEARAFHGSMKDAESYLQFFEDLDYGQRRNLIHTAGGVEIFERLNTATGMKRFRDGMQEMKSIRFVARLERLDLFVKSWEGLAAKIELVNRGHQQAIDKVTAARNQRKILAALVDADGAFGEAVRAAGFRLDAKEAGPMIAEQARYILDRVRVEAGMEHRRPRQIIAQYRNILTKDVTFNMVWDYLLRHDRAKIYHEALVQSGVDVTDLGPDRLVAVARTRSIEDSLATAERLTTDAGGGMLGLGERMGWLLTVSLLVCGIGISNAMLMTVTERFREIATLKCLGALDGVIMVMFVLESCFLGVVGGTAGAILGSLIGICRMLVSFGTTFAGSLPAGELFTGMGAAVAMGVVLAALAAVYPSFKAARLAPMEAMRVE